MKKAYFLFFYKYYKLFHSLSPDGLERFKASVVIDVLQLFLLIAITLQLDVNFHVTLIPHVKPLYLAIPLGLVVVIANELILKKETIKEYEHEFEHYPERKKRMGSLFVIGITILILALMVFSYYLLAQSVHK